MAHPHSQHSEKLYHSVVQCIGEGDIKSAHTNLSLLLQHEPNNPQLQNLYTLIRPRQPEAPAGLPASQPALLNLGCGHRCHPAWVNVNFTATGSGVIAHDLNQGLPFEDNSAEVVYHSRLLEHFSKAAAPRFLQECYRVLKPAGILRVVVRDLEAIVRQYLRLLEQALAGDVTAQKHYDWILLELFDQMVRNHSGGEMLRYWRQNPMPAEDFVLERMGSEVKTIINRLRAETTQPNLTQPHPSPDAHQIGQFRLSGEIHQWMYDRYSLGRLLQDAGFTAITVCRADESRIPDFNRYLLDIEANGSVRKPDSLFMEGTKPDNAAQTPPPAASLTINPRVQQLIQTTLAKARTALADGRFEDVLRLVNSLQSLNVPLPEAEALRRQAQAAAEERAC